ncbi:MAG: hypothetical protein ACI9CF_000749 [Candidatus Omnitrophota bacterium]|jgi:hypothetical protein
MSTISHSNLKPHNRLKIYGALLLLAVGAIALIMSATWQYKVGVAHDSKVYLSMTNHIMAGKGVYVYFESYSVSSDPIAAWPPLYPATIALLAQINQSPLDTAWVLNCFLFGANIFLIGVLSYWISRRFLLSVALMLFFTLGFQWRGFYTWLLSEPLFLFMIHLGIMALWKYLRTQKKSWLVLSALVVGCIPLIRYAGIAFIPWTALCILLLLRTNLFKRLWYSICFGTLASLPLTLWLIRNYTQLAYMRPKDASLSSILFGSLIKAEEFIPNGTRLNFEHTINGIKSWFSGAFFMSTQSVCVVLIFALIGAVTWIIIGYIRRNQCTARLDMLVILLVYALGYATFLAISLSFCKFSGSIPDRYLISSFTQLILFFALTIFIISHQFTKSSQSERATDEESSLRTDRNSESPFDTTWQSRLISSFRNLNNYKTIYYALILVLIALWIIPTTQSSLKWFDQTQKTGADESSGARYYRAKNIIQWFPTAESIKLYYTRKVSTL